MASVDYDDEIKARHSEKTLSTIAKSADPSQVMTIQQGSTKPPVIAIVQRSVSFGIYARSRRLRYPSGWQDLRAIPAPIKVGQLMVDG